MQYIDVIKLLADESVWAPRVDGRGHTQENRLWREEDRDGGDYG